MQYLVHEFSVQKRDVRVQRVETAQEGHEYLKSLDSMLQIPKKHVILDMPAAKAQHLITLNLEDKGMMRRQFHYVMANLVCICLQALWTFIVVLFRWSTLNSNK